MKQKILTIAGWMISIFLIGFLLTKLDFHSLILGFKKAKYSFLIAAASLNFFVVYLKSLRWKHLMHPQTILSSRAFNATLIGMAGNNVFPARGGDWLKIYLLGKWEDRSKSSLASIVGLDKLLDGLVMLGLFGILSLHSKFPEWVMNGTLTVSLVLAISIVICILLLKHHQKSATHEKQTKFGRIAKQFGAGMQALTSSKIVALTLLNSFAICFLQILTIVLCQIAFGLELNLWMAALIYVAINLAITIPSAPSGVGPFEAAAVLAYTWLGLTTATAFNIALMYHAVQFFPITLAGFIFYYFSTRKMRGTVREE